MRFALFCLAAAQAALAWLQLPTPVALALALLVFFAGLNVLEAALPAAVSKRAPAALRGVAVGIFSSLQFLGAFAGATAGGWLSQHYGRPAAYWFGLGLPLLQPALTRSVSSSIRPVRVTSPRSVRPNWRGGFRLSSMWLDSL